MFPNIAAPGGENAGFSECARYHLAAKPRKGTAILFHSIKPTGELERKSLHTACPVIKVRWALHPRPRSSVASADLSRPQPSPRPLQHPQNVTTWHYEPSRACCWSAMMARRQPAPCAPPCTCTPAVLPPAYTYPH